MRTPSILSFVLALLAVLILTACPYPRGSGDDDDDDDSVGDDDDSTSGDDDDTVSGDDDTVSGDDDTVSGDDDDAVGDDDDTVGDDDDATPDPCDSTDACGTSNSVSDTDGNTYDAVDVCGQCWLTENLNTGSMQQAGGSSIGESTQGDNLQVDKFCFNNSTSNCNQYGGLYQWNEAMSHATSNPQGICPSGWHIPSASEWDTLATNLGSNPGSQLKTGGGTGFDALTDTPYFYEVTGGIYDFSTSPWGQFWTSTSSGGNAQYRKVSSSNSDLDSGNYGSGSEAISVRCVKD